MGQSGDSLGIVRGQSGHHSLGTVLGSQSWTVRRQSGDHSLGTTVWGTQSGDHSLWTVLGQSGDHSLEESGDLLGTTVLDGQGTVWGPQSWIVRGQSGHHSL